MDKKLKDISLQKNDFPKDFLWGASVSSHQVEGRNNNQWTEWEHQTAAHQAKTAKKRLGHLSIWSDVKQQAENPHNYISGLGIHHYVNYKLDIQLAKKLHLDALRTGLEWSRICPKEGVVDAEAIRHYNDYLAEMENRKLEPVLNLFHWTVPRWFAMRGGFAKKENLVYWEAYIHAIITNIDLSRVRYVTVINEANTYMGMGYHSGEFPPGNKSKMEAYRVYRNLMQAQRSAYKMIKATHPRIQVGSAHQYNYVIATNLIGRIPAKIEAWLWNWWWLKSVGKQDFIGVNYYFTDRWSNFKQDIAALGMGSSAPKSDLNWYMEPRNLEHVLCQISRRAKGVPILITENGVADMHDQYREWWLAETIEALHLSLKKKVPLIGYLHWSLLDNFEWQFGWFPKFGLVAVDRKTMQRKVKKSARLWAGWLSER